MRLEYKAVVSILVLLLSLLLLLQISCNCQSQDTVQSPSTTELKGKSFIWKISSNTTIVYLLGSVHVARPDIYPLDSVIENAFEAADNLVVEVNIKQVNMLYASLLVLKYGKYPKGEGLKDNIPADLYDEYVEQLEKSGVDIDDYERYRPWVLIFSSVQYVIQEMDYEAELGIDYHFLDKATAAGKEIIELETIEYQISQMSSIPDEVMVRTMLIESEDMTPEEEFKALFGAWAEGDAARLEELTFIGFAIEPELAPLYEKMYFERNVNMAQKIEEFLADDEVYFIVVGAGHLIGEKGIVNILKNKGYDVEQLDESD